MQANEAKVDVVTVGETMTMRDAMRACMLALEKSGVDGAFVRAFPVERLDGNPRVAVVLWKSTKESGKYGTHNVIQKPDGTLFLDGGRYGFSKQRGAEDARSRAGLLTLDARGLKRPTRGGMLSYEDAALAGTLAVEALEMFQGTLVMAWSVPTRALGEVVGVVLWKRHASEEKHAYCTSVLYVNDDGAPHLGEGSYDRNEQDGHAEFRERFAKEWKRAVDNDEARAFAATEAARKLGA